MMPDQAPTCSENEINAFLEVLRTTEGRLLERLQWVELNHNDIDTLAALHQKLSTLLADDNEVFVTQIRDVLLKIKLPDSMSVDNTLLSLSHYLLSLTKGRYDKQYVRDRIKIGVVQQKLALPSEWYFFVNRKFLTLLRSTILTLSNNDASLYSAYMDTLTKIVSFDLSIMKDVYFYDNKSPVAQFQLASSQYQEQLFFHKNYDELTGLPNRNMLKQSLAQILSTASNKNNTIALVKLCLDHFSLVNDSISFTAGDLILKGIGGRLRNRLHESDLVAYSGGDTYIIVLNELNQSVAINRICKRINEIINEPFSINDSKVHLTCSMGVAMFPSDGKSVDDLLKFSDTALNLAKKMGGNNYQFFNAELDSRLLERFALSSELHNAMEKDEFQLYYQPVVDLQTGKINSVEALIRWHHPIRGIIPPVRFIAIAEELSIIHKLGDWIVRQTCKDIKQWREQGINVPHIAINISPKQLQDPFFTQNLLNILLEMNVEPSLITLEITESLLMENNKSIESMLKEVKANGISLSMDDFGTGYSALGYLKHYPFDYVKIDQSFIRDILTNSGDAAISNAVISMAHSLGIKVIAEGVETEEQCAFLSNNMCDLIQGYFLSKPMPRAQAAEYFQRNAVLPDHLLRIEKTERALLLVDDEPNILAALKRLFRRSGYKVLTANSGQEGLDLLKTQQIDVIVSDQRMPVMTGVEFLRQAKQSYPATVRIVLSGYTELESITNAINEGSIYKFLTKPWDDQQLRDQIEEAFRHKEMADENRKLGLKIQTANHELATANRRLAEILEQKEQQIDRDGNSLEIAREVLLNIPIPMLGIDDDGMIAFANSATEILLAEKQPLLGANIDDILPQFNELSERASEEQQFHLKVDNFPYLASWKIMGTKSKSKGKLITFYQEK